VTSAFCIFSLFAESRMAVLITALSRLFSRLVVLLSLWRWIPAPQPFWLAFVGFVCGASVECEVGSSKHKCNESQEECCHGEMGRDERVAQLVSRLMSPDVQVPEALEVCEVPLRLSDKEVERVFIDHVPGVEGFLFRGKPGNNSLKFLTSCYRDGFRAFRDTDLHEHLLWLLRLVVHHGEAGGLDASRHLQDVAEAFQECQAVQARAVERAGLQIRGVATNFQGMLTRLVGEYKTVALQMLAVQHVAERSLREDPVPTHYANRLTVDVGEQLGLNADDVRRAALDQLAVERFSPLGEADLPGVASRCRELFDMDAMLGAFVAEVNGFNADSTPESLPRLFLVWASERLADKHVVFDEHTCSHVEVTPDLALAVFEDVFIGHMNAPVSEFFRGQQIRALFLRR